MTVPVRLQLSRQRGFNLQAHSVATNGLPAVNVARPTDWGNQFVVGKDGDAATCVALFRRYFVGPSFQVHGSKWLEPLRGRNLACWCKPGEPCHADVLLELAHASSTDITRTLGHCQSRSQG